MNKKKVISKKISKILKGPMYVHAHDNLNNHYKIVCSKNEIADRQHNNWYGQRSWQYKI